MLARRSLPDLFAAWNARWHAPFGPSWAEEMDFAERFRPDVAARGGPFAFQPNSVTRRFEYPWGYYAHPIKPGEVAIEVGGALSGFQFVLALSGLRVVNVDPFLDYGAATEYPGEPVALHERLNEWLGAKVRLVPSTIREANLPSDSVDIAYSISTLEHLPPDEVRTTLRELRRILRRGGVAVLTIDLFLDLTPFTSTNRNRWGTNVSVRELVEESGMEMVKGDKRELLGFDEFDPERIRAALRDYFVGDYPLVVQTLVLQR